MVELNFFPVAFRMAGLAFLTVFALVFIVFAMACNAFMRRTFVYGLADMAFAAFHFRVLSLERKLCLFKTVIESGVFPVLFVVAVLAIRAQTVFVLIILAMTVDASRRRFTIFLLRVVTVLALYLFLLLVRSQQRKVSLAVIEFVDVQNDDIRIPPLMVGMAFIAFLLLQSAVEALVFQNIRLDIFVAILAQARLCILMEADMTFAALLFKFGVPLDHLSGHQRQLSASGNKSGECQGDEKKSKAQ